MLTPPACPALPWPALLPRSVPNTWHSVTMLNSDVKELIPEFYSTDASFLVRSRACTFSAGWACCCHKSAAHPSPAASHAPASS